jgi:hypothetical protein
LVEGGKSIAVGGGAALYGRGQVFKVNVLRSAERQLMVVSSILVEGGKSIDVGDGAALE